MPEPKPTFGDALKWIMSILGLVGAIFTLLKVFFPTSTAQLLLPLMFGLVLFGILLVIGKVTWEQIVLSWTPLAMLLIVLHLVLSRPTVVIGTIQDSTGAPVKGADLLLTDSNGVDHKAVTNEEGAFEIKSVPEGKFVITLDGKLLHSGDVPSGIRRIFAPKHSVGDIVDGLSSIVQVSPTTNATSTVTPPPISEPSPTPMPTSTPTPAPSLAITVPLGQVVCPLNDLCRFSVEGTSSGMESGPDLQIVVFINPQWSDKWFPQPATFRDGNTWYGSAQIGDKRCWAIGDRFGIAAVALTGDQATRIPMGFQPLPSKFVAQSAPQRLVTTYTAVQINLSSAVKTAHTGSQVDLSVEPSSVTIEYDLGTGDWVLAAIPIQLDMSCMKELGFSVSFFFQGTGQANSYEVKLEDQDGTSYGWSSNSQESVTDHAEAIQLPLDEFVFWGDKDGLDQEMDWYHVANIQLAVAKHTGDAGGVGRVSIRDLAFVPPSNP